MNNLSQVSPKSFIDLETELKNLGKTSLTLSHKFYKKNSRDGERILAAKAEVTIVAFNQITYEKTDLPKQLVEAFNRLNKG